MIPNFSPIRRAVWQGWRWLLTHVRQPLLLGRKAMRRTFCGRIGFRTEYVIHATPSAASPSEVDQKVQELIQQSAQRFQQGQFFEPIAEQIDLGSGVITGRLRQGEEDGQVDHVIALYPKIP